MSARKYPEVFLGGSCNPTTWRRDEAIPLLQKHEITFYNPQAPDWSPEMIELENKAKANANVLLYVIDNQTRNVVSFMEVANFVGDDCKNLVVVINPYSGPGQMISSEKVTSEEYHDLNASLCLMKQLTECNKVATFSKITDAMNYLIELNMRMNGDKQKWMKMKEAFDSLDMKKCGLINSTDVHKALKLISRKRSQSIGLPADIVKQIEESNRVNMSDKINFKQFCKIVADWNLNGDKMKFVNGNTHNNSRLKFLRSLSTPPNDYSSFSCKDDLYLTDIYLGGDCHPHLDWRQKLAIPLIKNACLTFFNPEHERRTNQKLSSTELAIISNSKVVLFVISNNSRSLFSMILAAYNLGLNANVVLCIQQLPEKCIVGSHELSALALKDYNRGRIYLSDMARRRNVPIFESVEDAVQAAVDRSIR